MHGDRRTWSAHWRLLGERGLHVDWRLAGGARLTLVANLGGAPLDLDDRLPAPLLWASADVTPGATRLSPWSVCWSLVEAGR